VAPTFTDDEYAEIIMGALRAGLTPTGFCAVAAVRAARGDGVVAPAERVRFEALANLQAELFAARTAVSRIGINLNQAVAALHATGQAPRWLEDAATMCARSVAAVDEVTSAIHRRVR
jgi:hypothetical protein